MKAALQSLDSEALTSGELARITGCARHSDQIIWLATEGWIYLKNKAGHPIVGRLYARMKLAGISTAAPMLGDWQPNFDKVR